MEHDNKRHNWQLRRDLSKSLSRRSLLKGIGVLAVTKYASALTGSTLAYVGTYTPNGGGIHIFNADASTGHLSFIKFVPVSNPSWIAFDPQKKYLYAVNEISNFNGTANGSVTAYSVNPVTGDLTLLNVVSSQGGGPAHLSVHPSGKWVFVANYGGGNVAVLPVLGNGSLGNAVDVKADNSACSPACAVGPTTAASGPPGSFAVSGHDAPHAHMIQSDPSGNFVIVNDVGLDLTIIWNFDSTTGLLSSPRTVPSSAGAGPRHFAFHPNGRWFYSVNEEASTVEFMTYTASTGTLVPQEEVTALPPGFAGTNFAAEIIVSPDGGSLFVSDRLHNSIATLKIDGSSGRPLFVSEALTAGDYPRSCNFEPNGLFLYACNQRSDDITLFFIHPSGDGDRLELLNTYTAVGSPASIIFRRF